MTVAKLKCGGDFVEPPKKQAKKKRGREKSGRDFGICSRLDIAASWPQVLRRHFARGSAALDEAASRRHGAGGHRAGGDTDDPRGPS